MNCPRCAAPTPENTLRENGGVCPRCLLNFAQDQDAPEFPGLEVQSVVGQGGMGVVYKAVQKTLGRTVALKVLSPELSADPDFVDRFTREAQALAQLNHPNIVAVYDSGVHDRVPYLIMEFVDGISLRSLLASKTLDPSKVLEIVSQVCDALQYAHDHWIVHRDIKPENILLDRQGRVKIADFGLALIADVQRSQVTRSGVLLGTPHYMAPEQFDKSASVDHRADIFALGVVFYEMLTGERPQGMFQPPSQKTKLDPRVDAVVLQSLAKEPERRFQSAAEMKERLSAIGQGKPGVPETKADEDVDEAGMYSVAFAVAAILFWINALTSIASEDLPLSKALKACLLPLFFTICWLVARLLKFKRAVDSP